ncbi:LCP family protein [Rhodococcus spelaei]|uniref:LCP family protein n=1 Tax=Rhodococcus spelaei TaxID=2546320 RepID=UPI001FE55366|nr:LCP family protein [Rhodococcus spelaei]
MRTVRVFAAAASVVVLCSVGFGWAAKTHVVSGLHVSDALSVLGADGPRSEHGDSNILLIGLDSRKAMDGSDLPAQFVTDELHAGDSDVGGYNTNTLILLHVPGDGSRATAAAIPRDDYVAVPGYGMRKIKEAYGLAKFDEQNRLSKSGVSDPATLEQKSRDAGRRSTLTTVQNLLRVPIDHFAEVNLIGFYHIAQALGPLRVCLNAPVRDAYSGANFPAGKQTLDPSQALAFVRQRHGLDNGDLDRTHRQQAFISAVIANLKSTGVIGNIGKMQALLDVVKKDVVIDSGLDPVTFASQADNLTSGSLDLYTLPIEGYATIDSQDVNKVDPTRLRAEIANLFKTGTATASTTTKAESPSGRETIDVVNGTGRAGLAGATAAALASQGYRTGSTTTGHATESTTVTYGSGAQAVAQVVADQYSVTATASSALPSDRVSLTLGADSPDTPPSGETEAVTSPAGSTGRAPDSSAAVPTAGPQGAPVEADHGTPCVD